MIQLFVYRKIDGAFMYVAMGSTGGAINDLGDNLDFTLTPLPDHENQWYWKNDSWVKKD